MPKEIGDFLHDLEPKLRSLLDECHFKGVEYDYQDEPAPSAARQYTNIDRALACIDRARRLTEVCGAAVEALDIEHSKEVALTMGNELWEALDDAKKELERGAR